MKLLITITLIMFCLVHLQGQIPTKPKPIKWSDEIGKMSWNAAKRACLRRGMRLPLGMEIIAAYEAKVIESWRDNYWTLDVYTDDDPNYKNFAFYFKTGGGGVFDLSRKHNYFDVRCVHYPSYASPRE